MRMTPVPNIVFDSMLAHFTGAELKVFLVIVRKTLGWYAPKTGGRKKRDWISSSQFIKETGLSDMSVTTAIASLSDRKYILITDNFGNVLYKSTERKGRQLYFQVHPQLPKFFS